MQVKPRELEDVLRMEYRTKLLNPKWAQAMAGQARLAGCWAAWCCRSLPGVAPDGGRGPPVADQCALCCRIIGNRNAA